MGMLLDVTLAALCLTLMWRSTVARSDPMVTFCDDVCWEESAVADECIQHICSRKQNRPRAYRKCRDACRAPVDPCLGLCFEQALSKLPRCQRKCHRSDNHPTERSPGDHCQRSCLIHFVMRAKARRLPKDYIGYTTK